MQPQFVNDKYVSPLKYPKSDVACLPIMLVTTILLWTLNCPVNGRAAGPSEISPERASAGLRRAVAFYRARSKMPKGMPSLCSATFAKNIVTLAEYLAVDSQ